MDPVIPRRLDRLTIVKYPAPVLRQRCQPVEVFGDQLSDLTRRMLQLMHDAKGVGLAAPQVGILIRLFVCSPTGEPGDDGICINPTLTDAEGSAEAIEGCLSIPGVEVSMRRATAITMHAFNPDGSPFEQRGEDLLARVWRHETDHLDGRLIVDNMSEADKIQTRRALKQLREDYNPKRKRASSP